MVVMRYIIFWGSGGWYLSWASMPSAWWS